MFSLINGLLLRPLPVPHSEQLEVLRIEEGGPQPEYSFCTPFFRGLENRHDVFTDVFAYNPDMLQVRGRSGNENVPGMLVSGQFFSGLQVAPLLGRTLTPQDDRKGADPVVGGAAFGGAPAVLAAPLAMLLTGLEGIGPATRVQVSPPQRKPSTQPLISSWSGPAGVMVEL